MFCKENDKCKNPKLANFNMQCQLKFNQHGFCYTITQPRVKLKLNKNHNFKVSLKHLQHIIFYESL